MNLRSAPHLGLVLEGVQVQRPVLVLVGQTVGGPLHEERICTLHTGHDHLSDKDNILCSRLTRLLRFLTVVKIIFFKKQMIDVSFRIFLHKL